MPYRNSDLQTQRMKLADCPAAHPCAKNAQGWGTHPSARRARTPAGQPPGRRRYSHVITGRSLIPAVPNMRR
jgi:hypothetical protein